LPFALSPFAFVMPFPPHIDRLFDAFAVPPDTKAAVYDLYVAMGEEALEVFGEIAESVTSPAALRPEDTAAIRERTAVRYLQRNHPQWTGGRPTASFWRPRALEGRASGIAIPLGNVESVVDVDRLIDDDQPVPDGIVIHGRNAHFGGRAETISFDVVAAELPDALAFARAAGQQHTMPGSAGETSGTVDAERGLALIWEVQPNVYKPAGDRNRDIARLFRRHRNWHLLTLAAALGWLRERHIRTYVLRGTALAAAHEVNPAKPVSGTIETLHDRTAARVAGALGLSLLPLHPDDEQLLLESFVMNVALEAHARGSGVAGSMWRVA
jgi:hypothetical protein